MDVDKKVRFTIGFAISFVVIGVAAFGWLPGFDFDDRSLAESLSLTLAKIGAFGGMAMFAWSLILSGRYKIFDTWFGGQDKMYLAHRFFGTFSVALLVMHPLALVVAGAPEQGIGAAAMLIDVKSLSLLLGIVALYGLVGIIVWTITTRAKHETFLRIHKLLGLLFVLGAAHAFLSGSVLAANQFVFWYMAMLSLLAIATFIHYTLLADIMHPYQVYTVSHVQKLPGQIIDIRLKPKYRHMLFAPGQYAYICLERLQDHGYHPFTIASAKRSDELQFYIKVAGDFTEALATVRPGEIMRVKGAYGGFTFDDKRFHRQLWIAGGIGITPFLSCARSLPRARRWPQIELLYAVKHESEAFAAPELDHIEAHTKAFNYTLVNENAFGLQSLSDLLAHFGNSHDCAIYICGPPAMLRAYAAEAKVLGLTDRLYYEEFSFR